MQLYWRPGENIGKPSWPVHNPRAAVLPLCSRFLQAVGRFLQQDKIYNASVEKVVIMFWRWPAKLACWATTGSVRAPSRSCVKIVCSANAPFENIYQWSQWTSNWATRGFGRSGKSFRYSAVCFSGSWSPNSAWKNIFDANDYGWIGRKANSWLGFNLEAVAGEDDGLLVVAPQPTLHHVRLQLQITCEPWINWKGKMLHFMIISATVLI